MTSKKKSSSKPPADSISLDQAVTAAAYEDFTAFKMLCWPRYLHADHLELIDLLLMDVARYIETDGREGTENALIEMPPRHGKSKTVSQLFPAWFMGRNPHKRVLMASYGASLAHKNSRMVRNLMKTANYQAVFPGVMLAEDSQAKDHFDLVAPFEGGLDAFGKGGGATGKGGHLLLPDDMVKDRAEAESDLIRENDWDWLTDVFMSRKEPNAGTVSIMTRWHNDDMHGRIRLNDSEHKWKSLTLPAIAEGNDDPLGRKEGEALWPARYPITRLLEIKKDSGEYSWNSLYQQHPQSKTGGLFKRDKFNIIDHVPPDIIRTVRFWDLAASEKTSADYTVGLLLGLTSMMHLVVLDVQRFQVEWDDLPGEITRVIKQDGKSVHQGIENVFMQSRVVKKLVRKPELFGYTIQGCSVDTDKWTRALHFATRVGEGMVFVMRRAWTKAYLDEMCAFNLGSNDDQVDATSGADKLIDKMPREAEITRYT